MQIFPIAPPPVYLPQSVYLHPYATHWLPLNSLDNWRTPLDHGRFSRNSVILESRELVVIDVDAEHHTIAAMTPRCVVSLLAVKVSGSLAGDLDIDGFCVRDIFLVDVLEVGIDVGPIELLAGVGEGRFGEGVVHRAEVEMDDGVFGDILEEWWVKSQGGAVVEANSDSGNSAARACRG